MRLTVFSSATRLLAAGFVLANVAVLSCSSESDDAADSMSGRGGAAGSAGQGGANQAGTTSGTGGKSVAGSSGVGASGGTGGSLASGGAAGSTSGSGGTTAGSGGAAGSGGNAGSATAGASGTAGSFAAGGNGAAGNAGMSNGGGNSDPLCGGKAGGARMERLNRGVVAVRTNAGNYVGWRLLGFEAANTGFDVYRDGSKINDAPITSSTNYVDAEGGADAEYSVRAIANGIETSSETASTWAEQYLEIPLQIPAGGMTPSGEAYTYSANDASIGDVDGDGEYEIILKWDPSNAKDNSQSGYTGNVYLDAYRLDGMRLWRIDLGRNIRAGAHYTQFMVYDFDGDGRAEVACKTSDGSRDGQGNLVVPEGGTPNANADYRNASGYVLTGNEYLTVFDGLTGAELATVDYVPARGNVSSWGDDYGNRVDRFLWGVAYLDGERPSLVAARGYYTRTVIVAWDFREGALTRRWTFDRPNNDAYSGQGDHSLSIADVDADGRQEIVYGAMTVDDNGMGLYSTGLGHGDALHVGDLDPSRPGLEVFNIQERVDDAGSNFRDARSGMVIWRKPTSSGSDEGPGRGASADILASNPGAEMWSSGGGISGLFNAAGANVGRTPGSCNFLSWWDADPLRELLDGNHIDKYGTSADTRLLTATDCSSNNGTKSTPALSGDILGDWREEVIWRRTDNLALRLYTTTAVTERRIFTLVHDPQYRVALAWQNTAYNQPPHPSFAIGDGMADPPTPNIFVPCP
jgi:rhamnogalacturonan endolyase